MQILFVHPNFPAQFGPVARRLAARDDVECVFASKSASGMHDGIRCIPLELMGGATRQTHYCSRTFENAVWNAHATYEACKADEGLAPDLIVGHSGFGTTVFLQELYDAPIVSLFEFFYRSHDSDLDFRPDFPARELDHLRSHTRNSMILTDLAACAEAYTPTEWQRDLFPERYRSALEVIHDGIDTSFWKRREATLPDLPANAKVVTFVARGLEAMRGFDVFVRAAKRILADVPDAYFVVVGEPRTHYGNDMRHIAAQSFRDHVLDMEMPDMSRFRFMGRVTQEQLVDVFSVSDLHVYLTVPFVLSWSLLDAMSCECPIVASDTPPVREVVTHGETGRLADFFDDEALAAEAVEVLRAPESSRSMARAGRQLVVDRYDVDVVYPRICALYGRALGRDLL